MFTHHQYLNDLLTYAEEHITFATDPDSSKPVEKITRGRLSEMFYQPFSVLVEAQEEEVQIHQILIVVEILHRLLNRASEPLKGEPEYFQSVYDALLRRWGITYAEIQDATAIDKDHTDDAILNSLARRLSIDKKYIPELLLAPVSVTETVLKDLFGVMPTNYSVKPKPPVERPKLLAWQLERLRQVTLPEVASHPVGSDTMAKPKRDDDSDGEASDPTLVRMEKALQQSFAAVVYEVQTTKLPEMRTLLLKLLAAKYKMEDPQQVADSLTKYWAIDFGNSGKIMTSRLHQAIETIQTILFGLRTGQFDVGEDNALEKLAPTKLWQLNNSQTTFDNDWRWMGSYTSWCAAMNTIYYPENFLLPQYLESDDYHQLTDAFKTAIDELQVAAFFSPHSARELAKKYMEELAREQKDWAKAKIEMDFLQHLENKNVEEVQNRFNKEDIGVNLQNFTIEKSESGNRWVIRDSSASIIRRFYIVKLLPDPVELYLYEEAKQPLPEEFSNALKAPLTNGDLYIRKDFVKNRFDEHNAKDLLQSPQNVSSWLKEIYYFVPMALALKLQQN
ncbi:MAG: hypothetical protein KDJ52_33390, partial [Anaerolineae bacterium]|nr:hypothetical protein [Anaerolineae bacterium]